MVMGTQQPSPRGGEGAGLRWLAEVEARMPEQSHRIPFAPLWWPQVEHVWQALNADYPELTVGLGPGAVTGLCVALVDRLSEVSAPTLVDVMTADLTVGQRFLRRVMAPPADPPRIKFAMLCRELSSATARRATLDAEYPVLADVESTVIRQWRESTVQLLGRLSHQRDVIEAHFGIAATAPLTGVALAAGDRHNDGRSVAVLAFGDARLVYKPRDVRLERLWSDVLGVVFGGQLRAPHVLAADDGSPHGFVEFIHRAVTAGRSDWAAYYRDAGRTLAVLYAIGATDCHHENFVDAGGQLVLVDAEALFETRGAQLAEPDAGQAFASVLDVGMLPQWVWLAGERTAIDPSALGATPGSVRAGATGWRAVNTDAMGRGPIDVPTGVTTLESTSGLTPDGADLGGHVEHLVAGFVEGYRALIGARPAIMARLVGARDLSRRLILRPTYVYAALLMQSWQPSALRSHHARDEVLAQLTRAFEGAQPHLGVLLDAELAALRRLDVPMFEAAVSGDRTRWLGGELCGWPGVDAVADVVARIQAFNDPDLAHQSRLIRSAVTARQFAGTTGKRPRDQAADAGGEADDHAAENRQIAAASATGAPAVAQVAEVAERVRRRIAADAVWVGREVSWLTLAMLPDGRHTNVARLGSGLYDGALGVAVFLHRNGDAALAAAALAPLLAEYDANDPLRLRRQVTALGLGFGGVGGHLRALRWLADQGAIQAALADRCIAALIGAIHPATVAQDSSLDVMAGVAGLVVPLASELSRRPGGDRNHLVELLGVAADRLADRQRADGGWDTMGATAPLTGYAHGASGIAVALATAYRALGEERYLQAAERGLDYEATTFDAAVANWPDFRAEAHGGFMLGWCAGAPGVALARMRLLELLPAHPSAARWRDDMVAAARTTAASPLLDRDHLCCGNLGRAAILGALGRALPEEPWVAAARRITAAVALRCGTELPRSFLGVTPPDVLVVPGLMTGLAGAGLVLGGTTTPGDSADSPDWVSALLL